MKIFFLFICFALTSCQVYRTNFDCPPGKGVPCTSLTTIEKMIVETPDGEPDIFMEHLPSTKPVCIDIGKKMKNLQMHKIWIVGKKDSCGRTVGGHYIYLDRKGCPPCNY